MNTLLTDSLALKTNQLLLASFEPDNWIALLIPLAGISIAIIAIIGGYISTDRGRKTRHETIRLALEKGQPIPTELLVDEESSKPKTGKHAHTPRNDRRSGLVLLAVGAGMFIFFNSGSPKFENLDWLGAIPGFVGIALLLNCLFEKNDPKPPSE